MVEAGAKIKKTVEENVSNLRTFFFLMLLSFFLYIIPKVSKVRRLETLIIHVIVGVKNFLFKKVMR